MRTIPALNEVAFGEHSQGLEIRSPRSFGLLESHNGMNRGVVDGDDEKEMFFELCSAVYGPEYVRVYIGASNRMDGGE
jgi:hypothetical protein